MNINSIRIVNGQPIIKYENVKYTTVELTLKTWYGRKLNILAYPINQGPTFGSYNILWLDYVNSKGEEIDNIYGEQFSKQIGNYLTLQTINNNI